MASRHSASAAVRPGLFLGIVPIAIIAACAGTSAAESPIPGPIASHAPAPVAANVITATPKLPIAQLVSAPAPPGLPALPPLTPIERAGVGALAGAVVGGVGGAVIGAAVDIPVGVFFGCGIVPGAGCLPGGVLGAAVGAIVGGGVGAVGGAVAGGILGYETAQPPAPH